MKWLPGQLRESARSVHKCFPTLTHSNCESVPATYVARSRNPGEVRLAGHVSPPRLAKRVGSALSDCHPTRSNTASTSTQGCLVTWPSLSSHATRSAGCVPPKKRLVSLWNSPVVHVPAAIPAGLSLQLFVHVRPVARRSPATCPAKLAPKAQAQRGLVAETPSLLVQTDRSHALLHW